VPFKYGHTDLVTQIVDIKHFTEKGIFISADVRRSELANDGYTFGQNGKVDEVSLPVGKLRRAWWRKKEPTYVMTSLAG